MNTPDTEWEEVIKRSIRDGMECKGHYCPHETLERHYIITESDILSFIRNERSSRDTYWKERVRKEVEGMRKDEVKWKKAKYDVKSVEAVIWNRALDTLLDNLK